MVDIPDNSSTTTTIAVGETITSELEVSKDHDWVRIELTAGQKIVITLTGTGANPVIDPYVYLRNSSGQIIAEDDDSGAGRNSQLVFTVTTSGTYYIDAASWVDPATNTSSTGTYTLSVQNYTPPPPPTVFNYDQAADQLVNGYWGGDYHAFNVSPGGSLTVNITALTAAGQTLARAALAAWSDVIGVNFIEVSTGGQITFDDNEAGAHAETQWTNHVITSSHVNVSTQWLNNNGTGLNSYSYQTYIHEIGHALGLGHAGEYNGDATYPDDITFVNDSWPVSIMSYFNQTENTYFANLGFTHQFVLTPMLADIVAMQTLYGASTTTRTGDTTYGFNNTANNPVYNASAYGAVSYTIVDSGGIDTLDYSGFGSHQLINLNVETFSNVGGDIGNVSIGRGTVIENAIGGNGNDTLVGNAANNVLNGGGGIDTASYAAAAAAVTVSLAVASAQATGGAGSDTLLGIENLTGSAFADTLTGNAQANVLEGGAGDDRLNGREGADTLSGGAGADRFYFDVALGSGVDQIGDFGLGDSFYLDGLVFSGLAGGTVAASAFQQGTAATTSAHRIIYDAATGQIFYDSDGTGSTAAILFARVTAGTSLAGANFVVFGVGALTIESAVTYALVDPEQNLILTGSGAIDGTGNAAANQISGNGAANLLRGLGGNDVLSGNDGDDTLEGGEGDDSIDGGSGDDTASYSSSSGAVTVSLALSGAQATGGAGSDTLIGIEHLTGSGFNDVLTGNSGANVLRGGAGDDLLDGGASNDLLDGGIGSDTATYASASNGVQVSLENVGAQDTGSAGSDTLTDIENLTGSGFADLLTGNASINRLSGGGGNDTLAGRGGNDFLVGGDGDDFLYGGEGSDTLTGSGGSDRFIFDVSVSSGVDQIADFGAGDSIHLDGLVFGGIVDGALAASAFAQGSAATSSAHRIVYDSATGQIFYDSDGSGSSAAVLFATVTAGTALTASSFVIFNGAPPPPATVESAVSYTLVDPEQHLVLTGADAISGTGNGLANQVSGNAAANVLSGLGGNDNLSGNGGNDLLEGGEGDDVLDGGEGSDTATYATAAAAVAVSLAVSAAQATGGAGSDTLINVENLTGSAFDDVLTGNAAANVLTGGAGNDTLDGAGGADVMTGGTGDDTYVVDNASDQTTELASEGVDTVLSSVAHTLKANIENLTLTGSGSTMGTGNGLANVITGNGGGNRLSGQAGNDTLIGNGGNDTLDGGAGADIMIGGVGNDSYVVDNVGDVVTESSGEGTDTVKSSISYTLGANVENLVLGGSFGGFGGGGGFGASINGTGNELANSITGSSSANILSGRAGNDILLGGGGNDTLYGEEGDDRLEGGIGFDQLHGGSGADLFQFRAADVGGTSQASHDVVQDFSAAAGDRIGLDAVDADTTVAGNQAFAFIGTAAFTGIAGQLRTEQINGTTFIQGDTNGDGVADFWIGLTGPQALNASDFVL